MERSTEPKKRCCRQSKGETGGHTGEDHLPCLGEEDYSCRLEHNETKRDLEPEHRPVLIGFKNCLELTGTKQYYSALQATSVLSGCHLTFGSIPPWISFTACISVTDADPQYNLSLATWRRRHSFACDCTGITVGGSEMEGGHAECGQQCSVVCMLHIGHADTGLPHNLAVHLKRRQPCWPLAC